MIISEVYQGVEGEGVRIGTLQLFIRTFGCSVKCRTCDTKYTWDTPKNRKEAFELTPQEIADTYIKPNRLKWISITGGDPLLQKKELIELIKLSHSLVKNVNIEVTGLEEAADVFELCDFISSDIKTPNTGVEIDPELITHLYYKYIRKIQFKAVVANEEDIEFIKQFSHLPVIITPCWEPGKQLDKKFLEQIQELLKICPDYRMIVQQHKLLFGAATKLV